MGKPIKEVMGKMNRKFPSWASFISKASFSVGILEAHEEKQKPETKNKKLKARLFCTFLSILSKTQR
jgi:hypothetical protein